MSKVQAAPAVKIVQFRKDSTPPNMLLLGFQLKQ
jgi:hypothetical protein